MSGSWLPDAQTCRQQDASEGAHQAGNGESGGNDSLGRNTGQASGYELEYLGETVRQRVMENSGIALQWEIKRVGNFMPGYEVKEFLGKALA